jgi:hypothetical protein
MRRGLTLNIIVSAASLIVTYFFVPEDLQKLFGLLAIVAVIVGYQVGRLTLNKLRRSAAKIAALIIAALVCVGLIITYFAMIGMGSANTSDIVWIAAIFAFAVGAFSFLTAVANVNIFEETT